MTTVFIGEPLGKHYLAYEGKWYLLDATRRDGQKSAAVEADSRLYGRQLENALQREGLMREYVRSCQHFNLPVYYSWTGIVNSLGDHASMRPHWNGIVPTEQQLEKQSPHFIEI